MAAVSANSYHQPLSESGQREVIPNTKPQQHVADIQEQARMETLMQGKRSTERHSRRQRKDLNNDFKPVGKPTEWKKYSRKEKHG